MAKVTNVAEYISHAIELSGRTQKDIARDVGWAKPNVLSMMKQGITKVPIEKVPALARACGVDEANFLRIVMTEYSPDVWAVIVKYAGDVLSEDERAMLKEYREKTNEPA